MIEVQNLRKAFGSTIAVNGISFEVRPGEAFGLLGPNGAGKSTTIAMLTGALAPDAGTIRLAGGGSPSDAATRARIGVAPQALSLYEELTAAENLNFFGRLYSLAGGTLKHRVDIALDFAGLADRRADRIKTVSGGMKRRHEPGRRPRARSAGNLPR